MKHLLRYSLMCALSLLCLGANAQGVTFDFDNDYATLFPTLAGTSSNESHDGDFTASTTATVGGFSVTVSPADEGVTNANRIWSSAPRLRMYSGTLTVSGSGITKIEFTHKAGNFNLTASTGTLTDNVWTGNANEVVFSCSKNTQINKIVINGDGGSGEEPGGNSSYGTAEAPLTVAEALAIATALEAGATTPDGVDVYTKGVVTEITTEWSSQYNNVSFNISNDGGTTKLLIYRCKSGSADYVLAGDEVVIKGKLKKYVKNDVVTLEYDAGCEIISLVQGDGHSGTPGPGGDDINYGTIDAPLTVAEAIAAAIANGTEASAKDYYVKGKICSIKYEYSAQYGTATYNISEDGSKGTEFTVYGSYYYDKKSWQEGQTQIKEGDEVIVCGKIVNYNGNTPEFANKENYLVSLNGQTSSGTTPVNPDTPEEINVAKALEIISGLEASAKTDKEYIVTGYVVGDPDFQRKADGTLYGNVNLEIADEAGGTSTLTVFRAKSYENESFTEETLNLFKAGDKVVFQGKLQRFVKDEVETPELVSGYLIKVDGGTTPETPEEINVAKAVEIIYGLEASAKTEKEYIVTGYVVGDPDFQRKADGTLYGNVNLEIADAERYYDTSGNIYPMLTIFRAKSYENAPFTEETLNLFKAGDKVVFQGKLQRYVKDEVETPELVNGYLIKVEPTTGIQNVKISATNGAIYNLAGQRVEKATKGIYIQNGKKYIVK